MWGCASGVAAAIGGSSGTTVTSAVPVLAKVPQCTRSSWIYKLCGGWRYGIPIDVGDREMKCRNFPQIFTRGGAY